MDKIVRVTESELIGMISRVINESNDWGGSKKKLERTFTFKDFNGAIDFVNKVAKIAEQQSHHPDIEINYNKVKVSITDHEKGGVSDKCYKLVKSIDKLKGGQKESSKNKTEEMTEGEFSEIWSEKYKKSIDCNNPKGFSQKAHCAGKHKRNEMKENELTEKCWAGYTQKGMKTMFGKRYPNCVKSESAMDEASSPAQQAAIAINMKKKGIKPKNG
jgi:4a-hydroxytetrahydrobiopterin dehydratase